MRRDPTEFRKRFALYKQGKSPYEDGRPVELDTGTEPKQKTDGPINNAEIARRQAWAESLFRDNVTSAIGAKGYYQITDNLLGDYNKANKTNYQPNDMYNRQNNTKVRNWSMNELGKSTVVNPQMSSDSVTVAKQLAAYNWGRGNLSKYLANLKEKGIDIYDSWGWVNGLPTETKNYVNFILRNKNTGAHRTNTQYNKAIAPVKTK